MKLLVLAGGYGTRLYPLVQDTPKALLKVAQDTLIDHTLNKFKNNTYIEEICVVTNDKFYAQMEQWAKTKKDLPTLNVINDGTTTPENRLGAIGDILFVLNQQKETSDWIVVGSDNLFEQDLSGFMNFIVQRPTDVCVGAFDIQDLKQASQYGVLNMDEKNQILELQEKPKEPLSSLISMCLYYFPQQTLPLLTTFVQETQKTDTTGGYLQWLCKKIDIYGVKFTGQWYDIGSIESFHEAQKFFSNPS